MAQKSSRQDQLSAPACVLDWCVAERERLIVATAHAHFFFECATAHAHLFFYECAVGVRLCWLLIVANELNSK